MRYVKLLAAIGLAVAIAWLIADPGFEPTLAIVVSLSTLISTIIVERRRVPPPQQRQSVSKSSIGIQAGGDVRIGDKHGK